MKCVVCDSTDLRELHPSEIGTVDEVSFSYTFSPAHTKTFRVVGCRGCSHRFCAPLPDGIADHYKDVVDEEYLRHAESRRLAAREVVTRLRRHASAGRVLDVGCATGDFLEEARAAGFDAEGLELSGWSSSLARSRGFTVHQERLEMLAARLPAQFDVVTLFGVIEHFSDPRAEMASIARLLRPGGLVALWTGDASAWLPRLLGRKWWYWQGQHIQYFTQASLRRLAEVTGFRPTVTERYPFAATYETISNSLRRYRTHAVMSTALRPLFRLRPVVFLRLPGEMLFLASRQ